MSQTLNIPNSSNLLDLNAMNWLESVLGQEELSGITNQIRLSQQSNVVLAVTAPSCSNSAENFVSFEITPKPDLSPILAQIQTNFDALCRENSRLKEELLLAVDNCICKKEKVILASKDQVSELKAAYGQTNKTNQLSKGKQAVKTGNNSFECDKCQKQCINARGLHIHQSRAHSGKEPKKKKQPVINGNSSFVCDKCQKQFINAHGLHVHQSRAHSGKKPKPKSNPVITAKPVIEHKCEVCQQSFDVWRKLYNHKFTHAIKYERRFNCDLCSKAFFSNHDLKQHRLIHTRKTTTTNDKSSCEASVVENAQNASNTQTKSDEPFQCKKCSKRFTSHSSLLAHKKRHMTRSYEVVYTQKEVKCTICNKKLSDNQNLKRHLKTHTVPSNKPID